MISLHELMDEEKCYQLIRELRWPEGVKCPHCHSEQITKKGFHHSEAYRQRYKCWGCGKHFDDLSETVLADHHQPLSVWVLGLYLMGLNLSNAQIGQELNLNPTTAQQMMTQLRQEVVTKKPIVQLEGEIESDEVYVVAGHKGNAAAVEAKGRLGRRRRLKGARGRGTLEKEKPPILGLIERGGQVVLNMLDNVQQTTIEPVIQATVKAGSLIYPDEYNIYTRLTQWGYQHKSVNHAAGEFARDEDGDGFHEVHVNTIEGFWSLLRSWLRPHRGISQEKLPLYLGFFEFVHNVRKRGKALLPSLLLLLLNPCFTY